MSRCACGYPSAYLDHVCAALDVLSREPEERSFERRRLRVYVAGPITKGNHYDNVHNAMMAGRRMVHDGLAPYVPHFDAFMFSGHDAESEYRLIPPLLHYHSLDKRELSSVDIWGPVYRKHTEDIDALAETVASAGGTVVGRRTRPVTRDWFASGALIA